MVVSSVASVGATLVGGAAQMWQAEAEGIHQKNALTIAQANAEAEKNQLQAANSINQDRQSRINQREMLDLKRKGKEFGYKASVLALIEQEMDDARANANFQTQTRANAIDADIKNMGRQKRAISSSAKATGRLAMLGAGAKAVGQTYGFSRDYVSFKRDYGNKYG